MTFQRFFKARREKKNSNQNHPVDTKFKMRVSKVSSPYGFVQIKWHILGNRHQYPKHAEPFDKTLVKLCPTFFLKLFI